MAAGQPPHSAARRDLSPGGAGEGGAVQSRIWGRRHHAKKSQQLAIHFLGAPYCTWSRGYHVSTGCFTHLQGVYFGERIIDGIVSYQALYLHLHIRRRLQHALTSVGVMWLVHAHLRASVCLRIAGYV